MDNGSPADKCGSDIFAPTHWSVIVAAGRRDSDPAEADRALSQLCQAYWKPVYVFIRSKGYSVHDAQDLTQSFFLNVVRRELYTRANRERGRFRCFLLTAVKHFLADAYHHASAVKRGGGQALLPLDESTFKAAESSYRTHCATGMPNAEDRAFDRSWVASIVNTSLERLAAQYRQDGKEELFDNVKIFLTGTGGPLPTYDELSKKTGLSAAPLRSHVLRLRRRYRELVRLQVRETVASNADVDAEMQELFRVLVNP